MAISVDPLTDIIYVPKADLTLIQASPEVREIDLNWFHLRLKDWEDGEEAIPRPRTHNHNTEVSLAGLTYARIIEILDPYTVEFEDGQYTVNCVGANHNISDKKVPNQVSLIVNNAAGLITNTAIEYASFNGGVTLDVNNTSGKAVSGTEFPIGTPQQPSDNIDDAYAIAEYRGFPTFFIKGDLDITTAVPDLHDYEFVGDGMDRTTIDIDSDAVVNDCAYQDATVTGTLDGNSRLVNCLIDDLTYVKGFIEQCVLAPGTITLAGSEEAHFLDCWSGVPGTSTPTINMGGSGQSLALRNYNGGIKLTNKSGVDPVSIDLNSGQIILDSTVTNGEIVCRGIGKLTDNSVGATVFADDLLNKESIENTVWDANLNDHSELASASVALRGTAYTVGTVTIDTVDGESGTTWPIGSYHKPVDNLAEALQLMAYGNVDDLVLVNDLTVLAAQNISNLLIRTIGRMGVDLILDSGCTADGATFRNLNISGEFSGNCTVLIEDCSVGALENFRGVMNNVSFMDGAEISFSSWGTIIAGTAGGEPTSEVEFDLGTASINISQWTGNVKLKGKTGGARTVLNCNSGNVIIDSSCTGGTIQLIGVGVLERDDSGPGCTVDTSGFVTNEFVADAVWTDANGLSVLSDLAFIKSIEGGRWHIVGNEMIFYQDDNTTEIARFTLSYDINGNPDERVRT